MDATGPVLIVAPHGDLHASVVQHRLMSEHRVQTYVLDLASLGSGTHLSLEFDGATVPKTWLSVCGQPLSEFRCIWWRRASARQHPRNSPDPVASYCQQEYRSFTGGVFDGIDVPVINDPRAEISASRKPLQLHAARRAGLDVPRTLMTNDPGRARQFWKAVGGRCVYKSFTAAPWTMLETRLLKRSDLELLSNLSVAPAIFQEYLSPDLHVRASVFGDQVLAAATAPSGGCASIDHRMDLTATMDVYALPRSVERGLIDLLELLGLAYGCADLIVTTSGEHKFLEINPAGQFLYVEIEADVQVSSAMAGLLASSWSASRSTEGQGTAFGEVRPRAQGRARQST